jgi:hypothetical protein
MTFGYSMPTKSPLEDLCDYLNKKEYEKAQQKEYQQQENLRIAEERKQLEEKLEWLQRLLSKMELR